MMYRALSNLEIGGGKLIRLGTIFSGDLLGKDTLKKLIELGHVSRVSAPPLEIFPEWKSRAKKLAKVGIFTVEDFVSAGDDLIREALKIGTNKVQEMKQDALANLEAPDPGCGCGS